MDPFSILGGLLLLILIIRLNSRVKKLELSLRGLPHHIPSSPADASQTVAQTVPVATVAPASPLTPNLITPTQPVSEVDHLEKLVHWIIEDWLLKLGALLLLIGLGWF